MPKTAPSPAEPYEAELCTNDHHGAIVVFRIVECEIADVLDLVRLDYIEDFGGDIRPCVFGADFRKPWRDLARLVVFIPIEATDTV